VQWKRIFEKESRSTDMVVEDIALELREVND
jgi:hypothetical protein